jgi:hypothetical protein
MEDDPLGSSKYQQEIYDNLTLNGTDRVKIHRLRTIMKENLTSGRKRILEQVVLLVNFLSLFVRIMKFMAVFKVLFKT